MTSPLRLGVAGLGTVGVGVANIVAKHRDLLSSRSGRAVEISAVTARDRARDRGIDLSGAEWIATPQDLAVSDKIDVFVELMGGEDDPAKSSVEAALRAGKHVVTANKALLAMHGNGLARLAEDNGVALNYEAAVAGGIPIVKTMRESAAANRVARVFGIMNGTCNFILTKMRNEERDFGDVLKEAQDLGYAEADPSFDIGGFDAAHKLAILTSLAFGCEIDFSAIYVEGIEEIVLQDIKAASDLGYKIKLLGVAVETEDGIEQRVHPTLVPKGSNIAEVDGVFNAVGLEGDFVGNLMLNGAGAGAGPTASAVMADVVDIARGNIVPPLGLPTSQLKPYRKAQMRAHEGGYYIALELFDQPGEVAAVAQCMADLGISLESIMQHTSYAAGGPAGRETAPFIIITHDTLERDVRAALRKIEEGGHLASTPRMIRIERFLGSE
ncbi:MAG: homoserine dehydrogenase [Pseudomonadota bacterium]